MVILKDVNQINELVNSIFEIKSNFESDDFSLVNDFIPENILKELKPNSVIDKNESLEQLSLLVFQLKNYIPALCNIVNLLLITKSFDAVYYFTTRIFNEHIGSISYTSNEKNYNYSQKMFDRFIEIVKNCQISKENYIPFILYIFKNEQQTKISVWQEPALEYLKKFENENEQWVYDYIFSNKQGFDMLYLLCIFSTQKGIKLALNYYKIGSNEEQIFALFKDFKKEFLLYIDKELSNCDNDMQNKITQILFSWGDDSDAKARLEEVYKQTQQPNLRSEIAHKIGSIQLGSFKNEKNFLFAVRRNIKEAQERTLGLPFDKCNLTYLSGLKTDFAGYTYLINLFKEENNLLNLEKFHTLSNVFNFDSLTNFANQLFDVLNRKEDINSAKWAVRVISLFANTSKLENLTLRLFDSKRIKEARYILNCMICSKREGILQLLKQLCQIENFLPYKQEFIQKYANLNNLNSQIICEQLLPEQYNESDKIEQRKFLYDNFIAGRTYEQDYFERLFIKNRLYNDISQDIVFGEYKFGRLYSAFVLKGRVKTFVYGSHIDDSQIAIIHTIDCDERMSSLFKIFPNSTFNQFEKSYFNVNNFSRNQVSVQSFAGTVVNPPIFFENISKYGFIKNKPNNQNNYNSLIHKMPLLNLLCELEYDGTVDEISSYKTLSNIYFYRLTDCIESNGKYITPKQNAISIGSLPARYFSHILSIIAKEGKETNI